MSDDTKAETCQGCGGSLRGTIGVVALVIETDIGKCRVHDYVCAVQWLSRRAGGLKHTLDAVLDTLEKEEHHACECGAPDSVVCPLRRALQAAGPYERYIEEYAAGKEMNDE